MSRDRLAFTLRLAVRSPFLFRGLEGRFVGVDAVHLRDERGTPIIPADQVRGVLREAAGHLAGRAVPAKTLDAVFGLPSGSSPQDELAGTNEPRRSRIIFADLAAEAVILDPEAKRADPIPYAEAASRPGIGVDRGETTRIAIDAETGSVKTGALQVLELIAPFGAVVVFAGSVTLYPPDGDATDWKRVFERAVALISSIGAMKSPGWGELVQAHSSVGVASRRSLALASAAQSFPERLRLAVTFDRPILVDAVKLSDNAVEGRPIVPGAVLKGALARRLELAGEDTVNGPLAGPLAKLRVGHAFPEAAVAGEVAERALPFSLVAVKGDEGPVFGDAALLPEGEGALLVGKGGLRPAVFQVDWKPELFEPAGDALGRVPSEPVPGRARTHTEIDDLGAAREHFLFTTIARSVLVERPKMGVVPRRWILDLDFGGLDEEERASAHRLGALLLEDGLEGIGRTVATATFERLDAPGPATPRPIHGRPDLWAIVLETSALMLDPAFLHQNGRPVAARAAYEAYWHDLIPGAVLRNFYAVEDFTGGYLARRRRPYHDAVYFPFLVTRPGSVFVIKTTDSARLAALLRSGLPVPSFAGAAPMSWRTCPYMPENGYGRISVDHLSTPETARLLDAVRSDAMLATGP